ncbi:MAG: ABC transporter permease [Bacteroidales bacterium]|nr:ABC transporter permease [Bacteroidales bacterium]
MLGNFIKVTFRHIAANKAFTAINILGLAIGIASSLIICLYVLHETSYDKFHSDYQNIYRVTVHGQLHDIQFDVATSTGMLAKAVYAEINEVQRVTRVAKFGAWLISNGNIRHNEDSLFFVDTNFLHVFDGYSLIAGNPDSLFHQPGSLVLTERTAIKYFNTTDVVGKYMNVEANENPFKITGVLKNPPSNTHIPFDMLASLVTYEKAVSNWTNNNVYTYLQVKGNTDIGQLIKQVNTFADNYVLKELSKAFDNSFAPGDQYFFGLQPLKNIHLHSDLSGELEQNARAVYVFSFAIVALLVLIIACINFMNLSSANSVNHSQEVIMRKVSGASKREIIWQFLTESVIYSLLALLLALLFVELMLPAFNRYLGLNLAIHVFTNFPALFVIAVFTLAVGVFSGSYPAYFISGFEPAKVIQGIMRQGLRNSKIRAVFVVVQFSISILIITITIIIYHQTRFMMKKDLGFDKEQVLVIRRSDALKNKIGDFKEKITGMPGILSATNSNSIPGRNFNNTTFKIKGDKDNTALLINQVFVTPDFCKTYNLTMLQGRFFDPAVASDSFACVINESAAKLIGLSYPVGTVLEQPRLFKKGSSNYNIIGLVKDFHFQSVDKPLQPLVICFMRGNLEGYINVKINAANAGNTIKLIENTWKEFVPEYPFVYFFLNDDFNQNYISLVRLGRIFIIFSVLAIFVATLGLFGLLSFIVNQRMREIGVRKALGASVFELVVMLVKETIRLILIATAIAWALSYFISHWWLESFNYRIGINIYYFLAASLLVIVIALSTVVYKSWKAASQNAGTTLKYE